MHHADAQVFEYDLRALPELILQFHRFHATVLETDINRGVFQITGIGLELDPVKILALPDFADGKFLGHVGLLHQDHDRRVRQALIHRLYGNLLELDIVYPQLATVGDDALLVGLDVAPGELARALQRQRAAALLHDLLVLVAQRLLELGAQVIHVLERGPEALFGILAPGRACNQRDNDNQVFHIQSTGGGGGASTSRLPFDCTIDTTPDASISSIMRAARL